MLNILSYGSALHIQVEMYQGSAAIYADVGKQNPISGAVSFLISPASPRFRITKENVKKEGDDDSL